MNDLLSWKWWLKCLHFVSEDAEAQRNQRRAHGSPAQTAGLGAQCQELKSSVTFWPSPFFFWGKCTEILMFSRSSCPRVCVCVYECIYLCIPCPAPRTGGCLPTVAHSKAVFSKLKNKTWVKTTCLRRRGCNTFSRTSFLGQSRRAPTERVFSVIKLPKLVTKRNRADMEDFNSAEGFGIMSQGTGFAKFLRKDSITWRKTLATGPQMGVGDADNQTLQVMSRSLTQILSAS